MTLLATLLVARPLNILAVAIAFLLGYLALRTAAPARAQHPRPLLVAAIAWGLYSAWEWLVQRRTPEADIRVDLLVIWPTLAILSLWALLRPIRWSVGRRSDEGEK
jgi:hypothetical protein